jgi:hypothetical protein
VEGNIGGGAVTFTYAKEEGGEFSEKVPTEAGTYIVKASIAETDEGYLAAEATNVFVISPKTVSLAWKGIHNIYNVSAQAPTAAATNLVGEDTCDITVEGNGKDVGEYIASATKISNANYKLPDCVNQTFIIIEAQIEYASEGYAAMRDDQYHGITVNVKAPAGAVVKYGSEKGSYDFDESPEYKKEGSYTVYYQIKADNYRTVEGKENVLIMEKCPCEATGPEIWDGEDSGGSRFAPLKARSEKQGKDNITLKWDKVTGATQYVIYGNLCNSKGHAYYLKKLGVSDGTSFKVKQMAGKKLDKGRMHKFKVIAMDEDGKIIEKSAELHVATKGKKIKNYTGLKLITPKSGKITLKVGQAKQFKAKAKGKKVPKHVNVRYQSVDPDIAKITSNGKITAVAPGQCTVYAFTQNGIYKAIKVTVK